MNPRWFLLAICVGLGATLTIPVTQADGGDWRQCDSIVGTWRVTIVSSVEVSYWVMSWHDDNTSWFTGNATHLPTGGGVWKRIHGRDRDDDDRRGSSYSITNAWFFDEDLDGFADYQLRSRNTLYVEGDTLHGTGVIDALTPDGSIVLQESVATAVWDGVRMKVVPED